MSVEIGVAIIGACALVVGPLLAYITARRTVRNQERKAEAETLADREKLIWDQAREFWDGRAKDLAHRLELEKTAREASTTALEAKVAVLQDDYAKIKIAHSNCEEELGKLKGRLDRAGAQLQQE